MKTNTNFNRDDGYRNSNTWTSGSENQRNPEDEPEQMSRLDEHRPKNSKT